MNLLKYDQILTGQITFVTFKEKSTAFIAFQK